MTDDLHRKLVAGGGKVFRRKRVSHGEVFASQKPPTMQEVNKGVWCKRCKARHPYNGSARVRLKSEYERRGKSWVLLWKCPFTDDVVGELVLGASIMSVKEKKIAIKRTITYTQQVALSSYPEMTETEALEFEKNRPDEEIVEELILTAESDNPTLTFNSEVAIEEE